MKCVRIFGNRQKDIVVERIQAGLSQKDGRPCDAYTCETFADECAGNKADITGCIFFSNEEA